VVVGIWLLVTGVIEIISAAQQRRERRRVAWLGLAGLLSVMAGVLALARPVLGAFALAALLGVFAVLYGVVLAALALALRNTANSPTTEPSSAPAAP
jgi:uncharacterized membrane protein HdeD (DUF308 family)